MELLERHLAAAVADAFADTPVVMVAGPRQAGKTTLVRALRPQDYVNLDLAVPRSAAATDPEGFLAGLADPVVIDEVQRVPDLFLAIKAAVDADPRPGRFLLTGSADVLTMPRVADALPGRMEVLTLWPFSQGELAGSRDRFVEAAFADQLVSPRAGGLSRRDLLDRLVAGGFPGVRSRRGDRREAWFASYLTAMIDREAMEQVAVSDRGSLTALVRLLAARNAGVLNMADIARDAGLSHSTLTRHLRLLETILLVVEIPAWSTNLTSRVARAPKVVLCDSGLVAHVLGLDRRRLQADPVLMGGILEGFVAMEVRKQLAWSPGRPRLFHFRNRSAEVDLVLEQRDGRIVGIEVKSGSTVRAEDFRGLRALAELAGDRFVRGIVLHTGLDSAAFGPRLHALPVESLWTMSP